MKTILFVIINVLSQCLLSQETDCPHSINLVTNPHFDKGNTGFSSTLGYGSNCYTGYYYVGPNMHSKCGLWPTSFTDHTSGTGNFMMVDGNDYIAPQDVWIQSVQVFANKTYTFSFRAKNLYNQDPFNLGFVVNGVQIAATPTISYGVWTKYSTSWIAPSTSSVSIAIREITAHAYRDFGIDDIFMGYCIDETTGINSLSPLESLITIYPNPSTGLYNIYSILQSEVAIKIYDVLGNCIQDETPLRNNKIAIDLSNEPKGIYFVEIGLGNQKIVKMIGLQ